MPALHVVGEIVGASGLRPREAFSIAHWLDLLSLHPSSKKSFFCRWQLRIRDLSESSSVVKSSWSEWQVLQGDTEGQTQAHAWSPITPLSETITKRSSHRPARAAGESTDEDEPSTDSLLELDTLWSHPIDLHLAIPLDVGSLPSVWPTLEFQVWSLDEFHHEQLVGVASVVLPLAQQEFFLDLPITNLSRTSALESLGLQQPSCEADDDMMDDLVASSAGSLFVRVAMIQQGFLEKGVVS